MGYATGQFGKNHLGDRDEHLPSNHGFDEFFGNLYHLNAEDEPENEDYSKDPAFAERFGPRGVIHSLADGMIEDTGPLNRKRMETIDEEVTERALGFIESQGTMHMHRALIFLAAISLTHTASGADGNKLIRILESGQVAFGSFVREKTPEGARELGENAKLDFLFYDMEHGAFDVPTLELFLKALRAGTATCGGGAHTVIVRIPPVHDDPAAAKERIEALIEAGADGVALPHIMNAGEAAKAVQWIEAATDRMWPGNPEGDFLSFMMIEDRDSVDHAEEIIRTERVSIFSPGPGSLRGAYGGDMDAVQAAVAKVLAGCKAASVPCANTARESDVVAKVKAGFRLLIVQGEALDLGRKAARR